jgi:hypothetical protein
MQPFRAAAWVTAGDANWPKKKFGLPAKLAKSQDKLLFLQRFK